MSKAGAEDGAGGQYGRLSDAVAWSVSALPRNPQSRQFHVLDLVRGRRIVMDYEPVIEPGGVGAVYVVEDGLGVKIGIPQGPWTPASLAFTLGTLASSARLPSWRTLTRLSKVTFITRLRRGPCRESGLTATAYWRLRGRPRGGASSSAPVSLKVTGRSRYIRRTASSRDGLPFQTVPAPRHSLPTGVRGSGKGGVTGEYGIIFGGHRSLGRRNTPPEGRSLAGACSAARLERGSGGIWVEAIYGKDDVEFGGRIERLDIVRQIEGFRGIRVAGTIYRIYHAEKVAGIGNVRSYKVRGRAAEGQEITHFWSTAGDGSDGTLLLLHSNRDEMAGEYMRRNVATGSLPLEHFPVRRIRPSSRRLVDVLSAGQFQSDRLCEVGGWPSWVKKACNDIRSDVAAARTQ